MPNEPLPIHQHALENLRVIRETMERAGSFTSIPGWGGVVIGVTAGGAAVVGQRVVADPRAWLRVWLIEEGVEASVGEATKAFLWGREGAAFRSGTARL